MTKIQIFDSHTAGEPTRLIVSGLPCILNGTIEEQACDLWNRYGDLMRAIVSPPRSPSYAFGAVATNSPDTRCDLGLIFFNAEGILDMCVHGTIGAVDSLRYHGAIQGNRFQIATLSGVVDASVFEDSSIEVTSVEAFVETGISVILDSFGSISGKLVYSGNWFFLTEDVPLSSDWMSLTDLCVAIREKLLLDQSILRITKGSLLVSLVQRLSGRSSRGFVLCPGNHYDRSPCGTGLGALLAELYQSGQVEANQEWVHEGPSGDIFRGHIKEVSFHGRITPVISGIAYQIAKTSAIFDDDDPTIQRAIHG